MRRKRTPIWRTVQQILAEAHQVSFEIERGPMAPARYLSCTYEGDDGIEQRAHRATAPNLRKALQAARETWTLALVSSTAPHVERFTYHRLVHLKPPPAQAGAPAAPDVH
jgi:hypothetical protein